MMERKTSKVLSTSGIGDGGEVLFRVSLWVTPENMDIDPDDDGQGPTIRVKVTKGRLTVYGRIDRDAWTSYLTKDDPTPAPVVPEPTTVEASKPVLAMVFGSTTKPESVPAPAKPVSRPLFSKAKAVTA